MPASLEPPSEKNRRILVIDDTEAVRDDFKKLLSGNGPIRASLGGNKSGLFGGEVRSSEKGQYELEFASQGQQGLEILRDALRQERPFALAFVDMRMPPGWDGLETIKNLWQAQPDLEVVICTAYSDYSWDEVSQQLEQSAQLVILKKPFDGVEVQQLASALTEKYSLSRRARLRMDELEQRVQQRTTSLREANEQLERVIEELKHTQSIARDKDEMFRHAQKMELVGTLAGGVAHEFNNFLQIIGAYAQCMQDELSPEAHVHQDLNEVLRAVDKASSLTRQLLSFSRRQPLDMTSVDLRRVLDELGELLRPVLGDQIELELDTTDELGTVLGDAAQLQQALLNLCLNARDAMPNGGRLAIHATQTVKSDCGHVDAVNEPGLSPGPYIVISVSDTGCGMAPDVLSRVFDPFFTTKGVGKGTGLGLSMVFGTVQEHKGVIHAESEFGKGSKFTICLPVDTSSDRSALESSSCPENDNSIGTEVVLVAEDEPSIRRASVHWLRKAGYTVYEAQDGNEAVRVFEEYAGEISVLVFDVMMPHMTGHEAFKRIKDLNPEIRAVFCTGYDPSGHEASFALEAGSTIVEKPFSRQQLLKAVRRCLDANDAAAALSGESGVIGHN